MVPEEYLSFIVDFSKNEAVVPIVFRMCPFCGELIHDTQGQPPSGFPIHLGIASPKHKKNEYWNRWMKEREENRDKIKDL